METIVAVVVGFVLTTVAGGWWASRLQERSWARQNDVRLRELETERAGVACQELMSLLDKRLYRMQRLVWAAAPDLALASDDNEMELRRQEYVEVLFAWNDRLNTNLSVIGSYFGEDARTHLDGLYEDFARVGEEVEGLVRSARSGEVAAGLVNVIASQFQGREVGSLNDRVYRFGLLLLSQLREGQVGRYAPNMSIPSTRSR